MSSPRSDTRSTQGRAGGGPGTSFLGLRTETAVALVAIAALLVPLSALSQPADTTAPGGRLAKMRVANGLAQSVLGDVDATGETLRLSTLGLKNVAVALLWDRINHYKVVKDWTSFSAALEQMTKLQPHFVSVWKYQAHNVSYNISVEFDDYHDRYGYVIKGIDFLREGAVRNKTEPLMLGEMGWFIGHKIGSSDEKRQFRRLFREDDAFHLRDDPNRPLPDRDNWLVGREKYRAAQALVDAGHPVPNPLVFHSHVMKWSINYALALEAEGTFGSAAGDAWVRAQKDLAAYASREIPTSWSVPIRLALKEEQEAKAARLEKELEALLPGRFAAMQRRLHLALPPAQRLAIETRPRDRTPEQQQLADEALEATTPNWTLVAREAPAAVRDRARSLARLHEEARVTAEIIGRYRGIVNFDYWQACCEAEATAPALLARERLWQAREAEKKADLQAARTAYEQAFAAWRTVLDAFPIIRADELSARSMADEVERYRKLLDRHFGEQLPKPFVLQDVLDLNKEAGG
jgi:hypothetical protein